MLNNCTFLILRVVFLDIRMTDLAPQLLPNYHQHHDLIKLQRKLSSDSVKRIKAFMDHCFLCNPFLNTPPSSLVNPT